MANSRLVASGNNNNPAIYSTGVVPTALDTVFLSGFNLTIVTDLIGIAGNYSNGADAGTGAVQSATSFISVSALPFILNFNLTTTIANAGAFLRIAYPATGQTTWTGSISGVGSYMITFTGTNATAIILNVSNWNFSGNGVLLAGTNTNSTIVLNVPSEINNSIIAIVGASSFSASVITNSSYYKSNVTNAYFFLLTSPVTGNTIKVTGTVQTNSQDYSVTNYLFDCAMHKVVFQDIDWTGLNVFPIRGGNISFDSTYANKKIKFNLSNNTSAVFAVDTDPAPEDKVIEGTVYEHGDKEGLYKPVPKEFVSYPYPFGIDEIGEAIFTTIID